MDVRIDAARGKDASFSREYLCRGANFHAGRHAVHDAGITGLADRSNPPIADRNISLVDSRIVEDQRVGDHQIGSAPGARRFGRLSHAIADNFAATELHLVAVDRAVCLEFNHKAGISQTHAVSRRRSVMILVGLAVDSHSNFPFTRPLSPWTE